MFFLQFTPVAVFIMKHTFVDTITDKVTAWVGSTSSIVIHTFIFVAAFLSHWIFNWDFPSILLIVTTIVSLEAIYISIFIQRSVNLQAIRLIDVEESIDDVEEALDDVEEALDDVEESLSDKEDEADEISAETLRQLERPMEELAGQMRELLKEFKSAAHSPKKKKDSPPKKLV